MERGYGRYVRPESYYYGLLNELPIGATGLDCH